MAHIAENVCIMDIWEPINLTETCPANSNITACSQFGFVYLNLLVQLFGSSIEREENKDDGDDLFDFIVVGAGAAGCVVASRLSENPKWKVLLLEAGPEQPEVTLVPSLSSALLGSNIDWQYTTEPNGKSCLARPGGRCDWPKGKVMGGCSSINSMAYIRGNRVDYDLWAELGNTGWSFEEVLPFFKKSERNLNEEGLNRRYHGVDGEQYVSRYPYVDEPSIMMTDAFHERGLPFNDYNAAEQVGTLQAQAFSKGGERVSTNSAFIHPIRYKRKNLVVRTNSVVNKIIIENNRAVGVMYEHEEVIYSAFATKEVILSAGAIDSPKLLMLSGIGPRDHLKSLNITVIKELAVGENLQDHVTFNGIIIALPNDTSTLVKNIDMLQEVREYKEQAIKSGPISANGAVSSIAFIKTEPQLIAPDIQFQIDHVTFREEYLREPVLFEKLAFLPTSFYNGLMPRVMNLVPKSRGYLHLNSTNSRDPPKIYANYFDDPEDVLTILRGVRFLLTLEDTEAFKSFGAYFVRDPLPACKCYEWGSDEYFICAAKSYTATTYHPVGSCKMGPAWDKKAVVDNKLRVYGIKGLRVIDSSIMPVIVRGNTNAPSILIGERGVDFIVRHWKLFEYFPWQLGRRKHTP
ncbi:glucose dehydrogenase [FAD, quinone]-like [Aricia agestis]|uniref:glucose dehydrogenase [FAD, quinone]-like n=1 Tax=Aricia agestis TaxID=91739 RepID=UPI001C20412A|nr:glucose dehydrogenase [FAD, quinone]-like [Aricia agestis]